MSTTTALMMSTQTGIFFLGFSILFLYIFIYLIYIFWPTSHKDIYIKK